MSNELLDPNLEGSFAAVSALVADFAANEKYFLSSDYSEAQARKDFIDKLLTALGWDVNHVIQKNPYEQEVKVEISVHGSMAQRHADYSLSLAPHYDTPVLYVEAKRPGDPIADADNYFQVIRYANQPGHPIGILTSFAQLHIIDCRYQANIDTALARGIEGQKYAYSDFCNPDTFAKLFYLVSRPAKRLLLLHREIEKVETEHENTIVARQIVAADSLIDSLVYELYGLTDEEIAIVEEATTDNQAAKA